MLSMLIVWSVSNLIGMLLNSLFLYKFRIVHSLKPVIFLRAWAFHYQTRNLLNLFILTELILMIITWKIEWHLCRLPFLSCQDNLISKSGIIICHLISLYLREVVSLIVTKTNWMSFRRMFIRHFFFFIEVDLRLVLLTDLILLATTFRVIPFSHLVLRTLGVQMLHLQAHILRCLASSILTYISLLRLGSNLSFPFYLFSG
jgi:hypothetical protein